MVIFLFIAAIFGFILSVNLFLKTSTNILASRILGSFYFLLSVYVLQAFIIDGGYLQHFQWFFLWPLLPYHLIFIPIYYYFKVVITDEFKWDKAELILLVPFLIGLVDVTYVYLQPAALYNSIISETIANPETRLNVEYLLLSLDQHLLMRHLWQFGVLAVLFPEIKFFIKNGPDEELKNRLNKWLLVFWGILMLMAVLAIIYALEKIMLVKFFDLMIIGQKGGLVTFFLYLALVLLGTVPIFFPSILYGYPQPNKSALSPTIPDSSEANALKFERDEMEIRAKFDELKESRLFLKKSFNINECARILEMPTHHISYFLQEYYGQSFEVYTNTLRMNEAMALIEADFLENNSLENLAEKCGFTSPATFSKWFRKLANISPGEYARSLR
ncbi:helix-turn-helix domain-containing protein [Salegentibacter sp. HM20]